MNIKNYDPDQSKTDIYSSNYRYDNESSTDEEISEGEAESSDDDDDFKSKIGKIATRTSQQGKVRISSCVENKEDEEDGEEGDEFEEEMKREMERRVLQAEKDAAIANNQLELEFNDPTEDSAMDQGAADSLEAGGSGVAGKSSGKDEKKDKYDDIYFDSDDEDGENRKMKTDDDLLYDPNMDDEDQTWVDDVRRSYQVPDKTRSENKAPKPLPNSDAVLNCPACFTVVCLDCQRHQLYKTQYRAMFVINCSVMTDQVMKVPVKVKGRKGKVVTNPDDEYHPVRCDQCKTELAMYDKDEVYHFFNVVASHT